MSWSFGIICISNNYKNMKNKTIYQVMLATLVSFVMFGHASAQTATTTAAPVAPDFKTELAHEMSAIANDTAAQKVQMEIMNDDSEIAGDSHGDAKEIEGGTDQAQIDNEIDQEAEGEDAMTPEAMPEGMPSENNTSTEGN